MKINGIAAADGIGIGKVFFLKELDLTPKNQKGNDIESEIEKFDKAICTSLSQLDHLKEASKGKLSDEELLIFDAHKLILEDPELVSSIKNDIKNNSLSAEFATDQVCNNFIEIFSNMEDEYFKARAGDVVDVKKRLMRELLGIAEQDLGSITEETIIIARDLTPSETAQLNDKVVGFITFEGGRTSHSAIMARTLEIPAIVGAGEIKDLTDGESIVIDGFKGCAIINPSELEIEEFSETKKKWLDEKEELKKLVNEPTITKSGKHIELCANIGGPQDVAGALANGAEGIGLFRTEFLFMDKNSAPTEDEQFESYKEVLSAMGDKPVVVRTLDIGGDKQLPYLKQDEEMNPFLGNRALRLCFSEPEIFATQLRALLRASTYGNLKIMFPMIATIAEFEKAKKIVLAEKQKLVDSGTKVADDIEIGMMVEIPAAAVIAGEFAKIVDFMSIGTNDLIQYTMAADRMNEKVSYLYEPMNPAILRLIQNVIDAMKKENKWSGMCGEMAGDLDAIPTLVEMGLDEFSMSASSILKARKLINSN